MPEPSINPYASPNIDLQAPQQGDPLRSGPEYKLFSVTAICVVAFLASFAASAVLMAINYFRVGRPLAGYGMLAFGFVVIAAVLTASLFAPPELPSFVWSIAQTVLAYMLVTNLQGNLITQHQTRGGRYASGWLAAGIALLVLVVVVFLFIAVLFIVPESWLPAE